MFFPNPFQPFFAFCAMASAIAANTLPKKKAEPPVKKRRFEDGGECQGVRVQVGDDSPADADE